MSRLVHVVADYEEGEPAFEEPVARLERVLGDVDVVLTRVPRCDTLAAGFCVARLALCAGPPDRLVVHHVMRARSGRERPCAGRTLEGSRWWARTPAGAGRLR